MKETRIAAMWKKVSTLPILTPFSALRQGAEMEQVIERLAALTTGYTPDPLQEQRERTYYDYPSLKEPLWRWEIIWYFYFGGLAAGSYVIANLALLFGSRDDRIITRVGHYTSLVVVALCPPLLIKDLGKPELFLNMLRMFKVKSPMSMGTWGLLSFSMFSGIGAVVQAAVDGLIGDWWGARLLTWVPQKLLAIVGIPLGIFLGSYTGVLLAATSVPLWSRSKLLGAVFIASALSTATALISLVLRIVGAPAKTLRKLERIEWFNMLIEMLGILAFLRTSGRAAHALVGTGPREKGPIFWPFMFGAGLLVPWLLQTFAIGRKHTSKNEREHGTLGIVVSLLVLIGGYLLRRTVVEAGHVASADSRTTFWNARR
jgi:formate-dependent nitrite reductase membrane component NrfD